MDQTNDTIKEKLAEFGIQHFGAFPKGWAGASKDLLSAVAEGQKTDGLLLAVIGRQHFGNPIPRPWYNAAHDFLAS